MTAAQSQSQPGTADQDNSVEERARATPDERGPHDVPDERVIEKTLPNAPAAKPDRTAQD